MSGCSSIEICPMCEGESLYAFTDRKPYDTANGYCTECGFSYETLEKQLSLEEVNEIREDCGLPALKKLAERAPL